MVKERYPAFQKADFSFPVYVAVEKLCVRSCWQQSHNNGARLLPLHGTFFYPRYLAGIGLCLAGVGRIAENSLPHPVLDEAIFLWSVVLGTLCRFVGAARVQSEMKLSIELIKKPCGSFISLWTRGGHGLNGGGIHSSRPSLSAIPPLVTDGADVSVKYKGLSADGAVFAKLKDFNALCILRRCPFSTKSYGGDIHALKRNMLCHTVVVDLNRRGLALAPGKNQARVVLVPGVRDFVDGHVFSPFHIELPTAHSGRVRY